MLRLKFQVYNDSWKEFANTELGEMDFETKDDEWDRDSGHEDDMAMKEMDMKNMAESDMDLFNVLCFIFSDVNTKVHACQSKPPLSSLLTPSEMVLEYNPHQCP